GLIGALAPAEPGALRILAYHRILDQSDAHLPFLFDDGVISASTASFRSQMDYVRRNFDVISFSDLCDIEGSCGCRPRRPLIVTFDDGYRDNYTEAFPVLKELGIPATVFVTTAHMGSNSLFWWDLVAFCFKTTERTGIILDEIAVEELDLRTLAGRQSAVGRVLRWMKTVPDGVRTRFIENLPHALGVVLTTDQAIGMHLSWDEIRE